VAEGDSWELSGAEDPTLTSYPPPPYRRQELRDDQGWQCFGGERDQLADALRAAPDRVVLMGDYEYDLGTFEDPREALDAFRVALGQPPLRRGNDD
jgi:hypothetical protein